jgi:hypothetical protein
VAYSVFLLLRRMGTFERYAAIALSAGLFTLPLLNIDGRLVTFAVSDAALPFVLLTAALGLLAQKVLHRGVDGTPWQSLLPFVVWFVWLCVSAALGMGFRLDTLDFYIVKKLAGFLILAAYALAGYLAVRTLGYDRIVTVLVISGAVGSVIGLARLFLLPVGIDYAALPYGYRLIGMTHTPTLFGLQQAAVFIIAIDRVRKDRSTQCWAATPTGREWLIAIVLAGLWLSGSRTAIFALGAALLCGLTLRQISLISLVRLLVLSALIAIAAFLLFSGYRGIVEMLAREADGRGLTSFLLSFLRISGDIGIATTENQGLDHRLYIHRRALGLLPNHLWFGVGLGQFYLDFQASGDPRAGEIHNSYLWILTELGVFGLLIAGWCVFRIAIRALRLAFNERWITPLTLLAFYGIAAFGADVVFQRPLYFFAGILAALAAGRIPAKNGDGSPVSDGEDYASRTSRQA